MSSSPWLKTYCRVHLICYEGCWPRTPLPTHDHHFCCTSSVTVELYQDQLDALAAFQKQFELPDLDKTLRTLLQFAAQDGDAGLIFGKVRCSQC